jgi:hypothetical protein
MYRYVFRWTENGTETGYIMDFMVGIASLDESEIQLHGHWFGGYKPFSKKLKFEETEVLKE